MPTWILNCHPPSTTSRAPGPRSTNMPTTKLNRHSPSTAISAPEQPSEIPPQLSFVERRNNGVASIGHEQIPDPNDPFFGVSFLDIEPEPGYPESPSASPYDMLGHENLPPTYDNPPAQHPKFPDNFDIVLILEHPLPPGLEITKTARYNRQLSKNLVDIGTAALVSGRSTAAGTEIVVRWRKVQNGQVTGQVIESLCEVEDLNSGHIVFGRDLDLVHCDEANEQEDERNSMYDEDDEVLKLVASLDQATANLFGKGGLKRKRAVSTSQPLGYRPKPEASTWCESDNPVSDVDSAYCSHPISGENLSESNPPGMYSYAPVSQSAPHARVFDPLSVDPNHEHAHRWESSLLLSYDIGSSNDWPGSFQHNKSIPSTSGFHNLDTSPAPDILQNFSDTDAARSSDSEQSIEQSLNLSPETCTSGDGDSNIDEPFWIPFGFHGASFLFASQPLRDLETSAIQAVVDTYFQSHGNNKGGRGGDNSHVPSSCSNKQSGEKRTQNQRSLDSDQSSEETEQGIPAPKRRRTTISRQGQLRLACPFQKKDPERYPQCGIREGGYQTIGHMKQHLRRSHERNPNYCPRCKHTFPSEHEKNTHIVEMISSPCNESSLPLPDGLSPEMLNLLRVRVDKGISMEEQWYSVWELIFPGVSRPATCTFDLKGDMAAQTLGLCTFLEREGPQILTSFLSERNIAIMEAGFETAFNFDEVFQRRVISEAFRQIVTTWYRQRPRSEYQEDISRSLALPTPVSTLDDRTPNDSGLGAASQIEGKNPPSDGFEFGPL